jgi:hypothetical protein
MNRHTPHILVLCEDDANRQIARGFLLELDVCTIQVLPPSGGWLHVLHDFKNDYIKSMDKFQSRHMVLVVDFDEVENRLTKVKEVIPPNLVERVFVLGASKDPEGMRTEGLGTWEVTGQKLARDCRENTTVTWSHKLLRHNAEELKRMTPILKPILFP